MCTMSVEQLLKSHLQKGFFAASQGLRLFPWLHTSKVRTFIEWTTDMLKLIANPELKCPCQHYLNKIIADWILPVICNSIYFCIYIVLQLSGGHKWRLSLYEWGNLLITVCCCCPPGGQDWHYSYRTCWAPSLSGPAVSWGCSWRAPRRCSWTTTSDSEHTHTH